MLPIKQWGTSGLSHPLNTTGIEGRQKDVWMYTCRGSIPCVETYVSIHTCSLHTVKPICGQSGSIISAPYALYFFSELSPSPRVITHFFELFHLPTSLPLSLPTILPPPPLLPFFLSAFLLPFPIAINAEISLGQVVYSADEGNGQVTVCAVLTGTLTSNVVVTISTLDSTATCEAQYQVTVLHIVQMPQLYIFHYISHYVCSSAHM